MSNHFNFIAIHFVKKFKSECNDLLYSTILGVGNHNLRGGHIDLQIEQNRYHTGILPRTEHRTPPDRAEWSTFLDTLFRKLRNGNWQDKAELKL